VIEDIKILEAVERYITGKMSPDERVYFEQLRKSNPEIDQAVVEHTFFLQQMNRFDETRKFKSLLSETHIHLAEKGEIKSPRLKGKAKVVYLFNRYKRVSAIAASIAGITALTISALVWSLSPGKPATEYQDLKRELTNKSNELEQKYRVLDNKIDRVTNQVKAAPIVYTFGGTSFLVDVKGYLVTNAHIVKNARNIAVQNSEGKELSAVIAYEDDHRDIAILKITDTNYKSPGQIPYSIRKTVADIAEPVYTLGFPRNEIVYGEGYIAARTGLYGDTLTCQITVAANQGNSGGPVLNRSGEVIGILTGKQTTVEGAVFAIKSKYISQAIAELQKDSTHKNIRVPSTASFKSSERTQQVKKVADYVYMVKVD